MNWNIILMIYKFSDWYLYDLAIFMNHPVCVCVDWKFVVC